MRSRIATQYDRITRTNDVFKDDKPVGSVFKHPRKPYWYSKIGRGQQGTILPGAESNKHKATLRVIANI